MRDVIIGALLIIIALLALDRRPCAAPEPMIEDASLHHADFPACVTIRPAPLLRTPGSYRFAWRSVIRRRRIRSAVFISAPQSARLRQMAASMPWQVSSASPRRSDRLPLHQPLALDRSSSSMKRTGMAHLSRSRRSCPPLIGQLKTSRANEVLLRGAIADQNAKVAALGAESARQQNEAAKAVLSAAQRAKGAEATSQRLAASAAHSAPGKPCEPSEALTSAWQ
jgi:hypothetical protein